MLLQCYTVTVQILCWVLLDEMCLPIRPGFLASKVMQIVKSNVSRAQEKGWKGGRWSQGVDILVGRITWFVDCWG